MIPKFRVWDKDLKKIRPADLIDLMKQISAYNISDLTINIVFMQSTGMSDINGVDIFEGDIVKPVSFASWIGVVKYSPENAAYILDDNNNEFVKGENVYLSQFNDGLEVLGNIYENPELMGV